MCARKIQLSISAIASFAQLSSLGRSQFVCDSGSVHARNSNFLRAQILHLLSFENFDEITKCRMSLSRKNEKDLLDQDPFNDGKVYRAGSAQQLDETSTSAHARSKDACACAFKTSQKHLLACTRTRKCNTEEQKSEGIEGSLCSISDDFTPMHLLAPDTHLTVQ